jgi:hypothetical protein
MWDRKAGHVDIADRKAGAGLKHFKRRSAIAPSDRRRGQARNVNRSLPAVAFFGEYWKAADVIRMLMSDQDRIQAFDFEPETSEARGGFLPAQSCVDENAGLLRCD